MVQKRNYAVLHLAFLSFAENLSLSLTASLKSTEMSVHVVGNAYLVATCVVLSPLTLFKHFSDGEHS